MSRQVGVWLESVVHEEEVGILVENVIDGIGSDDRPIDRCRGWIPVSCCDRSEGTGNHTILQLEDVIDCINVTLGDRYDFVFLLIRVVVMLRQLDAKSMNLKWHSQPTGTRTVKIEQVEGYLGPYHDPNDPSMVQVGEEQTQWTTQVSVTSSLVRFG